MTKFGMLINYFYTYRTRLEKYNLNIGANCYSQIHAGFHLASLSCQLLFGMNNFWLECIILGGPVMVLIVSVIL